MKIEDLNKEIRKCKKCRLAETRVNVLCGEGDLNAKIMLIAQAPGKNEDREGKMFIGPSGKVLDELLEEINLGRGEVYMTNLVKCMLPKYRKPKRDEIEICGDYLDREIELIDPEVLAPLGYFATKYLFDKYDISLPSKESQYGKLFLAGNRRIIPLQHPAALLYNDSIKKEMVGNYRKLKILSVDCKWYPVCPMKTFYEKGNLDKKWIELYCKGDWESCVRYRMEENGEYHPDWMLPDGTFNEELKDRSK